MRATSIRRVLFGILLPALARAQDPAPVKIEGGHRATPDCSIRLQGPIAAIRVIAWDRDSIAVSGSLAKGARLDNMFGSEPGPVRGVKMLVEGPPGQIKPSGQIELRVPAGARLILHTGSSDIEVTGLKGELDIQMLGGTARVNASPRYLNIDATYAALFVDGAPERMHLKSFEGDITMRGSSQNAEFSTVSGNIRVGGGVFDRAIFDATTGSITFDGEPGRNAEFRIMSHSAPVELQIGAKANVRIEATSTMGDIINGLTKQAPGAGPEGKGRQLSAELGKATARITIESFKGTIRLVRGLD
jgi:hypothetical protein